MWFCLLCRTVAILYIFQEIQDQKKRQVMMIQHHAIVDNIKAISLGGKNFRWTSIYVSNVTQHHLRCHPQTVHCQIHNSVKVKFIPQQAEVAQGVPGRLRPQIFLIFSTRRVVGRQSYAPADFTPGEIPGSHFQRLSRPRGTWFCRGGATGKNPQWHHRESIPGPSN